VVPAAPYPWLEKSWQLLTSAANEGRLHHALLLVGVAGTGKLEFSRQFARALMCEQNLLDAPCGNCSQCALASGHTHPDITLVDRVEKSTVISVEQIRALTEKLTLTSTYGLHRVAIINKAHTLTNAAANGLLKTLEEPGQGCVLMLLADRDAGLPATIRSRCQRIVVATPAAETSLAWLQAEKPAEAEMALEFAQGSPLLAQSLLDSRDLSAMAGIKKLWHDFLLRDLNPSEMAEHSAATMDTREALSLFMRWTTDLVKKLELSVADGRLSPERAHVERRYLSHTASQLQQGLHLDNASLKTQAVLEGVLADIRIYKLRIRAEKPQ